MFLCLVLYAFASVQSCLVVTCWERADLLALVGDVYCIFVTIPCGILGQVWYLIVSFLDLCRRFYSYERMLLYRLTILQSSSPKYLCLLQGACYLSVFSKYQC